MEQKHSFLPSFHFNIILGWKMDIILRFNYFKLILMSIPGVLFFLFLIFQLLRPTELFKVAKLQKQRWNWLFTPIITHFLANYATLKSCLGLNNWNIRKREKRTPGIDMNFSFQLRNSRILFNFHPIMLLEKKRLKMERFCSIHIPWLLKWEIIQGIW